MFSVVIPVFNHLPYLTECVLSAVRSPLVQEVLLLDDGSSDGSAALAKQLAQGALAKVRDLTPAGRGNRGAHATLNELVEQASGEWIAVLNSDDVFTPGRFELIARRLRYRSFDLIFGNVLVIDAQGYQLGGKRALYDPQVPFPANFDVARMVAARDWLPLLAHQNFLATTSNMVFRKSLWRTVGGFADLRYVHDWDFCLRAALEGQVDYVPHALLSYRVHASNTIKEDGRKVDAEVRALFERLQRDYPKLTESEAFAEGLAANPYLKHRAQPVLSVVLPPGEGREIYALALEQAFTGIEITDGQPRGQYVYAPTSVALALQPMHLQNAMLAIEMQDADFVLVSHSLSQPPLVGTHGLANSAVLRQPAGPKGVIARLFPGSGAGAHVATLLPGIAIEPAEPRAEPLPPSLRSPAQDSRPLLFVLPALFAVGGVERLVIDMMRQMQDRYRFVVITVERLGERQGSLHGSAEGAALAFYDLGELAPPALFLPMMERLRDIYRPSLVWIPNGSPWQCDNAAGIRQVFAAIPIVDQQVYDTEAGWISRYHEPGIRSYDRFIAINRKIERTFIEKYGMDPARIDMIYHSVNLDALGPAERTAEQRHNSRTRHRLPEGKQIFGWVGRLTVQKRPLEFLQFVRTSKELHPNRHFVMIGDGELGAECNRFIAENALGNVTRVPFSDKMGDLFAVMDGLLSASEYEGLPISMLEGLAMGVPIYSTDVGDVGIVLEEYQAGFVTPVAWNLPEYAQGFEEWVRQWERFRANARKAAPSVRERFGGPAVAKQYELCFARALHS